MLGFISLSTVHNGIGGSLAHVLRTILKMGNIETITANFSLGYSDNGRRPLECEFRDTKRSKLYYGWYIVCWYCYRHSDVSFICIRV